MNGLCSKSKVPPQKVHFFMEVLTGRRSRSECGWNGFEVLQSKVNLLKVWSAYVLGQVLTGPALALTTL